MSDDETNSQSRAILRAEFYRRLHGSASNMARTLYAEDSKYKPEVNLDVSFQYLLSCPIWHCERLCFIYYFEATSIFNHLFIAVLWLLSAFGHNKRVHFCDQFWHYGQPILLHEKIK
jgi:hypothetical protein